MFSIYIIFAYANQQHTDHITHTTVRPSTCLLNVASMHLRRSQAVSCIDISLDLILKVTVKSSTVWINSRSFIGLIWDEIMRERPPQIFTGSHTGHSSTTMHRSATMLPRKLSHMEKYLWISSEMFYDLQKSKTHWDVHSVPGLCFHLQWVEEVCWGIWEVCAKH